MGTFHIHHDFYTAHNDYSTPKPKTLAFSKHHLVCFISCFPLGDRMCIMVLNIAILVGTFCPHIVGFTWTTHTYYCDSAKAHCILCSCFRYSSTALYL